MQIRRFIEGDEAALFRVRQSSIHQVASRDYTREQVDAWAPFDLDPALWRERVRKIDPFVVLEGNEIVGYADVQPNGYIDHFFVAGDHGGKGVGSLLMRRIHEQAAALKLTELSSDVSRTAQPFFLRHGFVVVEQRSPVRRGVVIPNALLRKSLVPPAVRLPAA
jgi:putative acetyltransferase